MHLVRAKPVAGERADRNRPFTALKRALNLHPKGLKFRLSFAGPGVFISWPKRWRALLTGATKCGKVSVAVALQPLRAANSQQPQVVYWTLEGRR